MLAPALFCIAIDWILSSCAGTMGTTVGSSKFTDQDYADDAVLFSDCPSKWPHILSSFDEAARTMGLNTSWSKTKIQNLGHGVTPALLQLQGHIIESTDRFTYLGSDIHSSDRSTPEILRRISLASNIFGRLAKVWKRTGLSLQTKIRLYNARHLCTVIWLGDMDSLEAIRSIPHELPMTDLKNLLVPFCHERLSH